MAKLERARDVVSADTSAEMMRRRMDAGWRMSAIEWVRDCDEATGSDTTEPVPYGLRVAGDCRNLEQDPREHDVLMIIAQLLVREERMPAIAAALNERGYKTRGGENWSPVDVFNLMPRVIEASPKIFTNPGWPERRRSRYTE